MSSRTEAKERDALDLWWRAFDEWFVEHGEDLPEILDWRWPA